ncbi:Dam family site-specific DNA-(adenine-N6)-methyltransferase [Ruminococcus callidus]|jgi:DNA adenine methylase|uniref:Dam family site-specific DNA-(adenine-N6)-methyltransferase n=1 Tax=Ruminococcus callidus TaxID=40519 RepID=UPI003521D428
MAVKAPFNYIGNKYRIINSIQECFPEHIDTFVDLFCGGCDVSINTQANTIYANDINYHVIGILEEFQKYDVEYILDYIDNTIEKWQLSKTNEEAYKSFRNYYNHTKNPLDLYVLMCYSFNYQFRFNGNHDYNNPFGRNRSSFNEVMRNNLILFKQQIEDIHFSACDFCDFDYGILNTGDFIYADPPYLLTCGSYNDGKRGFRGWTEKDDFDLMRILTELSDRGVNFALSNVIEHKGCTNDALIEWIADSGYTVHGINFNYNNCNYHTNNRENVTKEVLITNY